MLTTASTQMSCGHPSSTAHYVNRVLGLELESLKFFKVDQNVMPLAKSLTISSSGTSVNVSPSRTPFTYFYWHDLPEANRFFCRTSRNEPYRNQDEGQRSTQPERRRCLAQTHTGNAVGVWLPRLPGIAGPPAKPPFRSLTWAAAKCGGSPVRLDKKLRPIAIR